MTVSNTSVLQVYTCNGVTTTFAIPFQWFDLTQIKVYKLLIATGELTQLVVNTDYIYNDPTTPTTVQTVDGVGDPLALSSAYKVIVSRNTPRTQVVDYINNGEFKAEDHERGMDRIVMELQEAGFEADNALKISDVDAGTSTTLPPLKPSSVIAVNEDGDGFELKDATDFQGTPGAEGAPGPGVPTGGTSGQLLEKASGSDYDAEWVDPPESLPAGGTTGQILTKASDDDGDADWEDAPAVSPTLTKGDMIVRNATEDQRLGVGDDGNILTADSTQLSGVKWKPLPSRVADMDYDNSFPQDVAPATGIGIGNYAEQVIFIRSNTTSNSSQPITADPPLSAVRAAGSKVTLIGAESTNNDQVLNLSSGTHLKLRAPINFYPGTTLDLISDGTDYYERSRGE